MLGFLPASVTYFLSRSHLNWASERTMWTQKHYCFCLFVSFLSSSKHSDAQVPSDFHILIYYLHLTGGGSTVFPGHVSAAGQSLFHQTKSETSEQNDSICRYIVRYLSSLKHHAVLLLQQDIKQLWRFKYGINHVLMPSLASWECVTRHLSENECSRAQYSGRSW